MIGSVHQQAGNWRDALAETCRPSLQVVSKSGGADREVGVNNSYLKLNSQTQSGLFLRQLLWCVVTQGEIDLRIRPSLIPWIIATAGGHDSISLLATCLGQ
jgi:hypothetical protein